MLLEVDRLGHETPAPMLDEFVPVLIEHLRNAAVWPIDPDAGAKPNRDQRLLTRLRFLTFDFT